MNKFYTLTVGGEEYKLRLTASAIMAIEKKLGKSLFAALEHIQDNMVETITTILWGAMQPLNAGFSMEKATGAVRRLHRRGALHRGADAGGQRPV